MSNDSLKHQNTIRQGLNDVACQRENHSQKPYCNNYNNVRVKAFYSALELGFRVRDHCTSINHLGERSNTCNREGCGREPFAVDEHCTTCPKSVQPAMRRKKLGTPMFHALLQQLPLQEQSLLRCVQAALLRFHKRGRSGFGCCQCLVKPCHLTT